MRERYDELELEVIEFDTEDVIDASQLSRQAYEGDIYDTEYRK